MRDKSSYRCSNWPISLDCSFDRFRVVLYPDNNELLRVALLHVRATLSNGQLIGNHLLPDNFLFRVCTHSIACTRCISRLWSEHAGLVLRSLRLRTSDFQSRSARTRFHETRYSVCERGLEKPKSNREHRVEGSPRCTKIPVAHIYRVNLNASSAARNYIAGARDTLRVRDREKYVVAATLPRIFTLRQIKPQFTNFPAKHTHTHTHTHTNTHPRATTVTTTTTTTTTNTIATLKRRQRLRVHAWGRIFSTIYCTRLHALPGGSSSTAMRLRVPLSPSPVLEIYLVLWQRCRTPIGSRVCDLPISLRDIYTRSDSAVAFLSRLRINRQLHQHSRERPRWRLAFSRASTYTPLILSKYMQRIFSRTFLEISIATRAFSDLHRHSRVIDRYTLACSMQIIYRLQYACTAHCSIEIRATDSRFSRASEPHAMMPVLLSKEDLIMNRGARVMLK
ncbi:unnamed protein product [Trichogramma brassicae]|uniref:Uncharacterized protein n=1 Tax=Trichogramma brassicae TaxID=86971 RepID=A0A6H5I8P6_9HYME|nr:unnamed protein product [Trichogramma brassicae]